MQTLLHPTDSFCRVPYVPAARPQVERKAAEFLDRYLGGLDPSWEKTDGEIHRRRILRSLTWIADLLEREPVERPLVLGDSCLFDWSLGEAGVFPWHLLTFTDCDLRYPYPYADHSFDFVLGTEVIEHLKDTHETNRAIFEHSGAKNAFHECFRVLAPGGRWFLTTPNACSRHAIARLLGYRHPFEWLHHVREYSPGELMSLIGLSGFEIEAFEALDVYDTHDHCPPVDELLSQGGSSGFDLRGDTFFIVLRRPR